MPGINTLINYNKRINLDDIDLSPVLKQMKYDESYFDRNLYTDKNIRIIFSGYKEYPYQQIDCGNIIILIEGAIYNRTINQIKEYLLKIIPPYINGSRIDTQSISDFIMNTDGEYIIYIIDSSNSSIVILNDGLGRLPLYIYHDDNKFIAGRALKFIVHNLPSVCIDSNALLEYFLFLAPLGNRTFFSNVFRLMPASIIKINYKTGKFIKKIMHTFNFDNRCQVSDLQYYFNNLNDQFMEATSGRVNYFKNRKSLMALSGGLDSRAVLMALLKHGVDVENITFRDYYNMSRRDLPVVKTITDRYNTKSNIYDLPKNDIHYTEKLIHLKDGMSINGIMGYVLQSLELLNNKYGKNVVFYTGDGGGYIVGPRFTGNSINSIEHLITTLISRNSIFNLDEISELLNIDKTQILNYFNEYFSNYPEKEFINKYDHFYFYEHLFKFSMEGEDRVRHYLWSTTPFYGIKFTRFAFEIKNKYLEQWKIYKGFLRSLDKDCIKIKYANWGLSLSSPLLPLYLPIREIATQNLFLKQKLIKVLRLLRNPRSYKQNNVGHKDVLDLKKYLYQLADSNTIIKSFMDTKALEKIISNETNLFRMYLITNIIKYLSSVDNIKLNNPDN